MSHKSDNKRQTESQVTVEEANRVLEVGRLLFSVLTEEEITELQRVLNGPSDENEIGNDGVTSMIGNLSRNAALSHLFETAITRPFAKMVVIGMPTDFFFVWIIPIRIDWQTIPLLSSVDLIKNVVVYFVEWYLAFAIIRF